jgi:hypothetical protein
MLLFPSLIPDWLVLSNQMRLLIICGLVLLALCAGSNLCKEECDKQYGHMYQSKFCSNHFTDTHAAFEFLANYCYFHCNVTTLYPGTCACPNYCYTAFGNGVCTETGCKCSPGYTGKDCHQKINAPIETTHLESLPYGELFGSPYVVTDQYKDNHPIFNVSVVSEIRVELNEQDLRKMISPAHVYDNDFVPCQFHFKNERINSVIQNVGIRPKGSLSRTQRKKGWKFDFPAQFHGVTQLSIKGQQEHLLGMQSLLAAEMIRAMGLPTHRSSFAKFYVNGVYYGLYWLQEEFASEFFQSRYHKVGGFYKCGSGFADLSYEGREGETYRSLRVWKPHLGRWEYYYDKKLVNRKDFTTLVELISTLNTTSNENFESKIEGIFNVDRFLKQFIVEICIMNADTYTNWNNNYLLYEDADHHNRLEYISHDFDLSYLFLHKLAHHNVYNWNGIVLEEMGESKPKPAPLTARILKIPKYRKLFTQHFKLFLSRVYGSEAMMKRIDYLKAYLLEDVKKDYFYGQDCIHDVRFQCPRNYGGWLHEIEYIKIAILTRLSAALEQLDEV